MAKKDLIEYIETNHSDVTFQRPHLCTLSKMEIRVLRLRPQLNITLTSIANDTSIVTHCRICLASSSSSMTYLFGRKVGNAITVLDKLHYCECMTSCPAKDDGYPEYICTSCSVLLESAYQLKILCSKTESKLLGVSVDVVNENSKADHDIEEYDEYVGIEDSDKQIEIIATMEMSDEDGTKNIYLVNSDEVDDAEEPSDVV